MQWASAQVLRLFFNQTSHEMKNLQVFTSTLIAMFFCCTNLAAQCPQGDVILTSQAEVDDFAANYPSCTEIIGALRIGVYSPNTSNITDLSNLPPIEVIDNNLRVLRNDTLMDLSGLENLTSIGGYLQIEGNTALTDLSGLESMTSIGGDLRIYDNDTLTDLSALENLTSIEGDLRIEDNVALIDLSGLENVNSIGGGLEIISNDALTDLSGLENLSSIGGRLEIIGNEALIDLSGLGNVSSIEVYLQIHSNPTLSICAVPPICDYLENGGLSDIWNNAPNCNSTEEIFTLCTVSTTTPDNLPQITISPNPTNGTFTLQGIPQGTYQIHDTTGRLIQSGNMQNQLSIDVSQEVQGVYFISIQIENETITKRIIKM